ncbi:hypothetical protein HDU76_013760 [Blyttiomyces sp. JEL0837]|nr:hypothetical protein HDU76_013760 [Blyttiomyces sp. JEL0837]
MPANMYEMNTVRHNSVGVPGDSMSTSISDLASEAKRAELANGRWKPKFPISCVVTFIVILTLAAVAVPLGAIISLQSTSSINDLSTLVMSQAVNNTFNQVQETILQPKKLLQVAATNQDLQTALTTNVNSLRTETNNFNFLMTLAKSNDYLNGIDCATYPNIHGNGDTTTSWPNVTFFAIYRDARISVENGGELFLFMDFTTGPYLYSYNPLQSPSTAVSDYIYNFAQTLPMQQFYTRMFTNPKDTNPTYWYSYNHGALLTSVSQNVYTSVSSTHPSFTCTIGFENSRSLDPLFENIKVTPNTHLFMMDVNTGSLLANSVPHSVFRISNYSDPMLPVEQYSPENTNDTVVRDLGAFIKGKYGNYSLVPNLNSTVTLTTTINGVQWFINLRYLDDPNNWLLVVAIPRSDFFDKTDNAAKLAIILSSVIGVVGVGLAAVASIFAMRPLSKLTKAMEKLTKLDFAALEGNILNERSFMREVRDLQITFATMCKAFASGIRRNKALTGGNFGASTTVKPSQSASQIGSRY